MSEKEKLITPPKPKVLLAEAQLDMIHADHMNYMIKFMADFFIAKERPFKLHFFNVTGEQTARARNRIVDYALKTKMDYLFFVDTDMVVTYEQLVSLFKTMQEKDLDVLSGLYYRRKGIPLPQIMIKNKQNQDWHTWDDYPKNKLVQVDGIGLGIAIINMRVSKKHLKKPWFDHEIYTDVVPTEDLSFCRKLGRKNVPIHLDTGVIAGHIGDHLVDEEFYNAFHKMNPDYMEKMHEVMVSKGESNPEVTE